MLVDGASSFVEADFGDHLCVPAPVANPIGTDLSRSHAWTSDTGSPTSDTADTVTTMGTFGWSNTGAERPPFAREPGPDQESVWDYPRPPAIVVDRRRIVVGDADDPVGDSSRTVRVLETASPPTFYLPSDDVRSERLVPVAGRSFCEWKGEAQYWALETAPATPIGWSYPTPLPEFAPITGWYAFYPGRIACTVDGEMVRAQEGGFYGGWITAEVVGPFKGEHGTLGW